MSDFLENGNRGISIFRNIFSETMKVTVQRNMDINQWMYNNGRSVVIQVESQPNIFPLFDSPCGEEESIKLNQSIKQGHELHELAQGSLPVASTIHSMWERARNFPNFLSTKEVLPELQKHAEQGNWRIIYKMISQKQTELRYITLTNARMNGKPRWNNNINAYTYDLFPQTEGLRPISNQIFTWCIPGDYGHVQLEQMDKFQKAAHRLLLRCHYEACLLFAEFMRQQQGSDRIKLGLGLMGVYARCVNMPRRLAEDALMGALEKYDFLPIDVTVFLYDNLPITLHGKKYEVINSD